MCLAKTVLSERNHSLLQGSLRESFGSRVLLDQRPDRTGDLQDLVDADPTSQAGIVAGAATGPFEEGCAIVLDPQDARVYALQLPTRRSRRTRAPG